MEQYGSVARCIQNHETGCTSLRVYEGGSTAVEVALRHPVPLVHACRSEIATMVNFGNFRPESIQITQAEAQVAVMSETYLDESGQNLP